MSKIPRQIIGSNDEIAAVDHQHAAIPTISSIHRTIHEGRLFEVSHIFAAVADAASAEILITTGTKAVHLRSRADTEGKSYGYLFEDAVASVAGTGLTNVNRDRNSANTAETVVTHTPTLTSDGTQLTETLIPGGGAVGGNVIGGSLNSFEEFELKPNSVYLIRLTNESGAAADMAASLVFYEEIA